jgi:hypothetical protein
MVWKKLYQNGKRTKADRTLFHCLITPDIVRNEHGRLLNFYVCLLEASTTIPCPMYHHLHSPRHRAKHTSQIMRVKSWKFGAKNRRPPNDVSGTNTASHFCADLNVIQTFHKLCAITQVQHPCLSVGIADMSFDTYLSFLGRRHTPSRFRIDQKDEQHTGSSYNEHNLTWCIKHRYVFTHARFQWQDRGIPSIVARIVWCGYEVLYV